MEIVVVFLFIAAVAAQTSQSCHDIDPAACQLMAQQQTDLCSTPSLANTACPKFCNLCPLQCYHCDDTVKNLQACNTTRMCATDEICMRKELKSYLDGHHEYQLTCEPKQHCDDGSSLTMPFGKRHVQSRDLIVSCCGSDLCNKAPETTTTVATTTTTTIPTTTQRPTPASSCYKDIFVVVDDGHLHGDHDKYVNLLLKHLVEKMDIGPNHALMSLAKLTKNVNVKWDLDDHTDKQSLLHAIQDPHFFTSSSSHGNIEAALNFMLNLKGEHGNRPDADDVVIMWVGESLLGNASSHDATLLRQVHATVPDVFATGIGHHASHAALVEVATDSSHVFDGNHWWYQYQFGGHLLSQLDALHTELAAQICG